VTGTTRFTMGVACAAWFLAVAAPRRATGQGAPLDSAAAIALLKSTCGNDGTHGGIGLISGVVVDAEAHPVASAALTVAWHRPPDPKSAGSRPGANDEPTLGEMSDAQGQWHVCGVPFRTTLSVRVAADEGLAEQTAILDDAHPVATLKFSLSDMPNAANVRRTPPTSALVVFTVQTGAGIAIGGVTLVLAPANGEPRSVVTDSAGRAIVPAVEPGRLKVKTFAIGYQPGNLEFPVEAGRNTVPLILGPAHVPVLATIRVIGDRQVLPRHLDFESRRALHQTTVTITAADIDKRNPVDTWQMLTNISAMRVMQYGAGGAPGVYAMSTRESPVVQSHGAAGGGVTAPCWYRVMVDGVVLQDVMPDLSALLPTPSAVHGIEVFAGLATIPPQYSGPLADGQGGAKAPACGLIAVWTK
jgi:hypothetical protein